MSMPQVLVRDIEPAVVDRLKERAKKNGRSFEAELRLLLKDAAEREERSIDMLTEARKVREMFTGRTFSDSAELIREDRDR
jgi:plasmid stability protein